MKRLLILASAAAMIGTAAPAYADDPPPSGADADFISQLNAAGLTNQDPKKAISAAKDMCSLMDNGTPKAEIQSNLVSRNPGLTEQGAAQFMTLAEGKYCSKYVTPQSQSPKSQSPKPSGAAAH
jgi:hypothetical protein